MVGVPIPFTTSPAEEPVLLLPGVPIVASSSLDEEVPESGRAGSSMDPQLPSVMMMTVARAVTAILGVGIR